MATRTVAVSLELARCASTEGIAVVVDRSVPARVGRALVALVACFAAAIFCVFIPLLHFILVPGFLITGVVLFVAKLREDCSLIELRGSCPRCKVPRVFPLGGRLRARRSLHCDGCGEQSTLLAPPSLSVI